MASNRSGDWRSNCPNLSEVMSNAKDKNLFTDITFIIGKDPFHKTFHAHKIVLACGSPVFEKMFFGDMAEKRNPIIIEDDDPEAFDMLINYIYGKGGNIKLNTFSSAWNYYSIGDKYLVESIREDAERFFECTCMSEEDFWNFLDNKLYTMPIIRKKINSYLSENSCKMVMSDMFLKLPKCIVTDIVQMDKLNVSEYALLQRVAKWGISNSAGEKEMKQLMRHIRFSTLKVEDFCDFTDHFPAVIDSRSCVEIMKHLHKKSVYKLPQWCSTNIHSRKSKFEKSENNLFQGTMVQGTERSPANDRDFDTLFQLLHLTHKNKVHRKL